MLQFLAGLLKGVGGGLAADPLHQLGHPGFKAHAGAEAQGFQVGGIGVAVADIAGAELVHHLGGQIEAHVMGEGLGHFEDGEGAGGADVVDAVIGGGVIEGQQVGLDDIGDVGEIAALEAVFVDHGGLAVEQAGRKDGGDAGVGVREGLASAVDVEIAQGHGGDLVGAANGEEHLFVVALVDSVDGSGVDGLGFGRGAGGGMLAAAGHGAVHLPIASGQLGLGAERGVDQAVLGAGVGALAIDGHGGGDDELAGALGGIYDGLQEDGGAVGVDIGIAGDLVHGLAHPDHGGFVEDDIDALQGLGDGIYIADIAELVLGMGIAVSGPGALRAQGAVDLRFEVIEDAHGVAGSQQGIDDVRADETGTAGDEDVFRHGISFYGKS